MEDVRNFGFPHRAIDQWNVLPEEVVCANNKQIQRKM